MAKTFGAWLEREWKRYDETLRSGKLDFSDHEIERMLDLSLALEEIRDAHVLRMLELDAGLAEATPNNASPQHDAEGHTGEEKTIEVDR